MAALYRLDTGPTGFAHNWDGYDTLLYINLQDRPIDNPLLGVGGAGFSAGLKQGGYLNDPLFGGTGDLLITQLPAYAVYGTLVPAGATDFVIGAEGYLAQYGTLNLGDVGTLVPEPSSLLNLSVAGAIGLVMAWRRRKRPA